MSHLPKIRKINPPLDSTQGLLHFHHKTYLLVFEGCSYHRLQICKAKNIVLLGRHLGKIAYLTTPGFQICQSSLVRFRCKIVKRILVIFSHVNNRKSLFTFILTPRLSLWILWLETFSFRHVGAEFTTNFKSFVQTVPGALPTACQGFADPYNLHTYQFHHLKLFLSIAAGQISSQAWSPLSKQLQERCQPLSKPSQSPNLHT